MKRSEIILPGHYCTRDTVDAEVKQIIRIIGKSNRNGYWVTSDKKEIPEYILLDEYVALDTHAQNKPKHKFGKDIFGDFQPIIIDNETDINNDEIETETSIETVIKTKQDNNTLDDIGQLKTAVSQLSEVIKTMQNNIPTINDTGNTKQITAQVKQNDKHQLPDDIFKIISKASIVSLNDGYEKKYGDRPYKQKTIQLTIDLPINYDLDKLKQLIELFELDEKQIIEYIAYNNVSIDYQKIIELILNELYKSNAIDKNETNKTKNSQIELENGIKEVENLLSNFLEK